MSDLKRGDMLRFTQWYVQTGINPRLQVGEVMWGIYIKADEFEPILGHNPEPDEGKMWVFDDEDDYTVVPIEEWPGEVCAIMAERALKGEN